MLEDLGDTVFDTDDFAVVATLADASTINVLFDRNPEIALGAIETGAIIATAKTSDVSVLVSGSTLVIGGVTYYVEKNEPDGTGISILTLSKDA